MELIHFEEIDSTSTYIKEHFYSLSNFTFVSSNYQSAGRGRGERTWIGEKDKNLLFSFLVLDKGIIALNKDLSLSCAYVLARTLEDLYGLKPMIKWPNDVYLNHKKTCGILLESHMEDQEINGIIIGIGINVNQTAFPDTLLYPVTSLALEKGGEIDISLFKKAFFDNLVKYLKLLPSGVKDHVNYAKKHNELLGKEVYAEINGEKKMVKALDIEDSCNLVLEVEGKKKSVCSGEITFHL